MDKNKRTGPRGKQRVRLKMSATTMTTRAFHGRTRREYERGLRTRRRAS